MDERESPKGALKMVSSGAMYALSFTTLLNYTMQFEWLTTISSPSSSSSTPSSITRDTTSLMKAQTQLDADQKLKKRLTEYFAIVHLKELNGDKEVQKWLLSRLQSRRGACQQAEILSMQVNLPPDSPSVPLTNPSPFAAFPNIACHRSRVRYFFQLGHQVFKP